MRLGLILYFCYVSVTINTWLYHISISMLNLRTFTPLLFVFVLLTSSNVLATKLDVTGLEGELATNVDAYLSTIDEKEYSTSLRFQSRLEENVIKALKALGYYQPSIDFIVSEDQQTLSVQVGPGPATLIAQSNITILGEAENDEDFQALLTASQVKVGQVLNHSHYEALKSGLSNLALQKGYFDGEFVETSMKVAPTHQQALITIVYNSGIRYHFGAVSIDGSQINEDRIQSLVPFEDNDPYLATQVGELNQNLSNTEWFSSVHVEPNLSGVGETRQLPMRVVLAPQSRNQLETGLGYSTDIGPKATLTWKKPWLNDRGHSFRTSLSISQPEQTATASYKIPLENVLDEYYEIKYGMKNTNKQDTKSFENNLAIERHWQLESGWHRTVYVRYLFEDYTQADVSNRSKMLLPGISFTRVRARGGSMPMWGDKQVVKFEATDKFLRSDADLFLIQGRTAWIRSIGNNHRGLARIDGGAIYSDELDKIPPSLRFFAGGDNSLRGYGYESISPTDSSGKLTGGQYMVTSSLEYQYRVVGDWWLAAFVDYGDAWIDTPDWKMGRGVGVRWASPVGPIRLDFAWPEETDKWDDFRIHFTLGPEL